jgi:hypothetical protein
MMLRTKKRSRDEILSLVDAEAGLQPQKKKRKLNSASRSSSAAYSKSDSTVLYEAVDIPGRSRAPYADKVLHKILRQLPERDSERPWFVVDWPCVLCLCPSTVLLSSHFSNNFVGLVPFRYADVLHKVPGAIDIVERKNLSQAQKSDFLFYVEISFAKGRTQEYYLKIFGDYEAGWAEATLPQTMAEKVANSADRKLIPEVHGACIRRLGNKKVDPQLGYFALMLPSGLTLKLLQREKVNLAWPLQWFCQEIFKMLLEFCLLDPYSSDYHFYHGDTNQNNYLIDTEKKRFVMIDFGRSYFAWPGRPNPFVLTARRDGLPPKQSTKDVATFYSVVAQLISLPNSSKTPENWNTWLSLLKFVSRKHLVTSTEPQNFQKWCSDHGIKIS